MRRHLVICLMVLSACATARADTRPLCQRCDSTKTVLTRFEPPEGFERVSVPDHSLAAWLRELRVLPESSNALDWRGRVAMTASEVAAVLDWRLLGSVEQCADIAVRLTAEYARGNGGKEKISFRSLSGQNIRWTKWLGGRYSVNGSSTAIAYQPGTVRQDTSKEFDAYLKFVMSYVNTASLVRDWPKVADSSIVIGDVLIQPSKTAGGLGHLSVVIDACTNAAGERLYLFTDGFTPARAPVVRERRPGTPESVWMTPSDYLELMQVFGAGAFHRPPAWATVTAQ